MKLILSGPTGFIGSEILNQALADPSITSIIALSRKPLAISDPKLTVVIIDDFLTYSPDVLVQLAGADACIWTIGAKAITDPELTQRVTVDYTMAAARAFSQLGGNEGKKFRFIQTSGKLSERDRGKNLWLFAEGRYVSGSIESKILEFADANEERFEAYVVKPGAVLPKEDGVMKCALKILPSVEVEVLGAAMLDLACNRCEKADGEGRILENAELVVLGREVLEKRK